MPCRCADLAHGRQKYRVVPVNYATAPWPGLAGRDPGHRAAGVNSGVPLVRAFDSTTSTRRLTSPSALGRRSRPRGRRPRDAVWIGVSLRCRTSAARHRMHRLPFCFAETTAVAVDRPSLTTAISSSLFPPDHDRPCETPRAPSARDLSGQRCGEATIACASNLIAFHHCVRPAPAGPSLQ